MLLGNFSSLNTNPGRAIGGFNNLYKNYKAGTQYQFYIPDTETTSKLNQASYPTGTEVPYSFILAPRGGQLSSSNNLNGIGIVTSDLYMGKACTAALSGSGAITSDMSLVTQLVAALSGSGVITSNLSSIIALAAALSGSGSISGALSILSSLVAALSGTGGMIVNLTGNANLSASIFVNSSTATVNEIVAGVWSALASSYNVSGTMGNKLNGAGSAGDPWTTNLSGYNTTDTAGKIMKQIKKKASDAASLSA